MRTRLKNDDSHLCYKQLGDRYARIVWETGEIYVPPVQMIDAGNGKWRFPYNLKSVL